MNSKKDIEINILDLILYICEHYCSILICAAILAFLGGGYEYYKQVAANTSSMDSNTEYSETEIDLNMEEQLEIDLYTNYEELYFDITANNSEDVIMGVDAFGVYYADVIYAISGSLSDSIIGESYLKAITINEQNYGSLYKLTMSDLNKNNVMLTHSKTSKTDGELKDIIVFRVYGYNKEDCEQNVKNLEKTVDEVYDVIVRNIDYHTLNLVSDSCTIADPTLILDYQSEHIKREYLAYADKNNVKNLLSDNVKEIVNSDYEYNPAVVKNTISIKSILKYIFIGGFAGSMMMIFVWAFIYVINDRLRYTDNFESFFGVNVIARLACNKSKGLVRWIESFRRRKIKEFDYDEVIEIIVANVLIFARKMSIDRVYMTGDIEEKEKMIIDKISEKLSEKGVRLVVGKPILYYANAMEESAAIGNIILVEKVGSSRYEDIAQEIDYIRCQELNLLGVVIIEG